MRKSEAFPSKFLSAADLDGKTFTMTIKSAPRELLRSPDGKEQEKTVLYFANARKGLPLNLVNWDSVAEICGDDSDDWPGQKIELYPSKTPMGGRQVACIRIRHPAQRELPQQKPASPAAAPSDDINDAIPF